MHDIKDAAQHWGYVMQKTACQSADIKYDSMENESLYRFHLNAGRFFRVCTMHMVLWTLGNQRKSEFILLFINAFSSIRPSVPCHQMIQVYSSKAVGAWGQGIGHTLALARTRCQYYKFTAWAKYVNRCAVGTCMYTCAIMKISITSGKYDLKIPTSFGETSFAIRQKLLKI